MKLAMPGAEARKVLERCRIRKLIQIGRKRRILDDEPSVMKKRVVNKGHNPVFHSTNASEF